MWQGSPVVRNQEIGGPIVKPRRGTDGRNSHRMTTTKTDAGRNRATGK